MKTKLHLKLFFLSFLFTGLAYSQPGLDVEPGVDRWTIKTTAQNFTSNDAAKPVALKKLLTLPLLPQEYSTDAYSAILIPKKTGTLKEGDIISTKGYLHLVALERSSPDHKDGDYHIQLTLNPDWSDSCFIVEIPYANFVSNAALKTLCDTNRTFIRKRLMKPAGKEPVPLGNVMQHQVYVKVTGQLFYDAIHASQMRNPDVTKRKYRGKKDQKGDREMHSYTAWEIHPVTKIEFAVKPQ